MARNTPQELFEAVKAALPQDGAPVAYDELTKSLTVSGYGHAVPLLRGWKAEGLIQMSVSLDDAGKVQHTVRLVN